MGLPTKIDPDYFDDIFRPSSERWVPEVQRFLTAKGIEGADILPFKEGSNLVAAVAARFVIKIFPPFHYHQWQSEVQVTAALADQLSLPIPRLVDSGRFNGDWTYTLVEFLPW